MGTKELHRTRFPDLLKGVQNHRTHSAFVILIRSIDIEELESIPIGRRLSLLLYPLVNLILGLSVWI